MDMYQKTRKKRKSSRKGGNLTFLFFCAKLKEDGGSMQEKKLVKLIKTALEKSHLYDEDEIHYMKRELYNLKNHIKKKTQQTAKGFENYETN